MYCDGFILLLKKRLTSSPLVDFESLRMKFAILHNVWRMLALKTLGRPVLQVLTDATWEEHRKKVACGRNEVQTGF